MHLVSMYLLCVIVLFSATLWQFCDTCCLIIYAVDAVRFTASPWFYSLVFLLSCFNGLDSRPASEEEAALSETLLLVQSQRPLHTSVTVKAPKALNASS